MAKTYSLGNTGIKGFDDVMRNLNAEISEIKNRSLKGLVKAAIIIRRDMDRTPPLIPVLTGNMRASWFVVSAKKTESGVPNFKGDKAGKITEAYTAAVSEAKGIVSSAGSNALFLVIGFGANYAAPVHEMYGKGDVNWTLPNSGPKFFESSIKRNKDIVLKTIRDEAQIKK